MKKQRKKALRNLVLYGTGSGVSQFGSQIYLFAIGLYVLNVTNSALSFAITMAVGLFPTIVLSPIAGVLSDKLDKKKIVVLMDFLNGVLFIGLCVYMTVFGFNVISIYIVSFLAHVFLVFFNITFESAKPQLVDDDQLDSINSVSQIAFAGTAILSPFIGGLIYAFVDIRIFIIVNGISFVLSAFSELFIDFDYNRVVVENSIEMDSEESLIKSIKLGWDYMVNKSSLAKLLGLFAGANFLFSFSATIPLPYILNNHLGMTSKQYGFVNMFLPVGLILGALLVGVAIKRVGYQITLYRSILLSFIAMGTLGLPLLMPVLVSSMLITTIYYSCVLTVFGLSISLIDVPIMTIIQSSTDEHYRGRVLSLMMTFIKAINPLAFLLSGLMLKWVNPFVLPLVAGVVAVIFIFIMKQKILNDYFVTDRVPYEELSSS